MSRKPHRSNGFTLLEMMIVLAALGIMVVILSQTLPFMQEKARDRRRISELSTLRNVIELFHTDTGSYPSSPAGMGAYYSLFSNNDGFAALYSPNQITSAYVPGIVPTYYDALPDDPLPGPSTNAGCDALGYRRNWAYFSNGEHYKLVVNCAVEAVTIKPDDPLADPGRCLLDSCWAWAISDNMDYATYTLGW